MLDPTIIVILRRTLRQVRGERRTSALLRMTGVVQNDGVLLISGENRRRMSECRQGSPKSLTSHGVHVFSIVLSLYPRTLSGRGRERNGFHDMMNQRILDLSGFDAAIFDLDGVITKTAAVHSSAWKHLFDEYLRTHADQTGEPFHAFDPIEDYCTFVDGKPRYDGVTSFLASRGITLPHGDPSDPPEHETICGLGNRKNVQFMKTLHENGVEVFPSTVALMRLLKSLGKHIAVVTASENGRAIVQAAGVTDLFEVMVDGRDARALRLRGKPHPDTFVRAAECLDVLPERAVVCEDALAGVEAGASGGRLVVGLDRVGQADALHAHGGDVVVSDLEELEIRDEAGITWHSTPALPSALDRFDDVLARFGQQPVVVFLDYDGTLTPIVDRPELAVLSQDVREVLDALTRHCPVGIISGRDRKDVTDLVNLNSLIFAGSHGFDIAGPEHFTLSHEVGTQFAEALDRAEDMLRPLLEPIAGALIERKKFSIAVHYRLVDPGEVSRVEEAVTRVMDDSPDLRRSAGKMVFEMQPQLDWDKGKALLWLLEGMKWKEHQYQPVYIGDDLTDEHAFRELVERGVGIVVEHGSRFSSASYSLQDTSEVKTFLMQLSRHLESRTR